MAQSTENHKLTPAMRQYHHFKSQYADAILFFRMGDFYETFYEDAKTCSQVLGIALTSRSKDKDPIPLAGIPYHALDGYLKKMIKAGYKVAICEQVEDPALAKGVVKRDVVRLVTPGTLTEESLLDERTGNYLAAVCFARALTGKEPRTGSEKEMAGLSWVELSTGQFFAQMIEARHVLDELLRLRPVELVVSDDPDALPKKFTHQVDELLAIPITRRPGWVFDPHTAVESLKKQFRSATLEGFGFAEPDCSIAAAGAVLEYLNETQKTTLGHISQLRKVAREKFLQLDQTTLRSLEITRTIRDNAAAGTLLHSIDKTVTAMGARKLRLWICYPLNDLAQIEQRQDAVAELIQLDALRDELRQLLTNVADIERISTRISTNRASPRDLLGLGQALKQLPAIRQILQQCSANLLTQLAQQCDTLDTIAALIETAIDPDAGLSYRDGGVIREGYDEEVDRLRSFCRDGQSWLADYQNQLIQQTGVSTATTSRYPTPTATRPLLNLYANKPSRTLNATSPTNLNATKPKPSPPKTAARNRKSKSSRISANRSPPRRSTYSRSPTPSPRSTSSPAWPISPATAITAAPRCTKTKTFSLSKAAIRSWTKSSPSDLSQTIWNWATARRTSPLSPAPICPVKAPISVRPPYSSSWPRWVRLSPPSRPRSVW